MKIDMNYESEIADKFINALSLKFSIQDEHILYRYLILRKKCLNPSVKKSEELNFFAKFILKELDIEDLHYKESKINLISGFSNSMIDIIENWNFQYKDDFIKDENGNKISFEKYISNNLNLINKLVKKEIGAYKPKFKKEVTIFYKLKFLNELFKIEMINDTSKIEGFNYNENINSIPIELQLGRYVHASNFNTSSLLTITEDDFESYLFAHLNDIEIGLRPIERQVIIEEGRIDILAKDINNELVILELKIADDKHLIWQSLYYPDMIKEKYKVDKVRMITVCPSYPNYIKKPLSKINYIESFKYDLIISNSKIEKMNIKKVK